MSPSSSGHPSSPSKTPDSQGWGSFFLRIKRMKSPTIVIGLLGKPNGKMKPEGGLLDSEMEMPEAMSDPEQNKANKAKAVMKAAYGPATGAQKCDSCEYFNTEYPEMAKGQGFCELWEFTCSDKNVCAAYEFNEELKEESEEEED